ncbi:MAG: hypothetical protein U0559_17550 [Anaerolineae bacterium]
MATLLSSVSKMRACCRAVAKRGTRLTMFTSAFDIILLVLVVMAGLLAIVGGLS